MNDKLELACGGLTFLDSSRASCLIEYCLAMPDIVINDYERLIKYSFQSRIPSHLDGSARCQIQDSEGLAQLHTRLVHALAHKICGVAGGNVLHRAS